MGYSELACLGGTLCGASLLVFVLLTSFLLSSPLWLPFIALASPTLFSYLPLSLPSFLLTFLPPYLPPSLPSSLLLANFSLALPIYIQALSLMARPGHSSGAYHHHHHHHHHPVPAAVVSMEVGEQHQFRDHANAPVRKLTVDLIKTYRHINDVGCCIQDREGGHL